MKKCLILTLLIALSSVAHAQDIINRFKNINFTPGQGSKSREELLVDSVNSPYGPHTSRYLYEGDIYENNFRYYLLDTLLLNFHRYTLVAKNNYSYQDLGTMGTATQPLFYEFPSDLGPRLGTNSVAPYQIYKENVRYYNTYSPLSDWYYAQGTQGKAIMDINVAQNIKPNWSAGLRYLRTNSRVIIGQRALGRSSRQAIHENFTFHTYFHTQNKKYYLLAHLNIDAHKTDEETGGIAIDSLILRDGYTFDTLFTLPGGQLHNRLSGMASEQKSDNLHLYHHYALVDTHSLQIFHEVNRKTEKYIFIDENVAGELTGNGTYYDFFLLENNQIPSNPRYQMRLHTLGNKVGLKGSLVNLFYAAYMRVRQFKLQDEFERGQFVPRKIDPQISVGGQLNLPIDKLAIATKIKAETVLGLASTRLSVHMAHPIMKGSYQYMAYVPSVAENYFNASVFRWNNNFRNTMVSRWLLSPQIHFKNTLVSPFLEHTRLTNYIYFDSLARPQQLTNKIHYTRLGVSVDTKIGAIRQVAYLFRTINDNDALRTPNWFVNYQIFYEGFLFKKALYAQLGFDIHYNTAFYADDFMPVTQQFYLQRFQSIGNYLQTDLFFNYRVNNVLMFIKFANALDKLVGKGYFASPRYMAAKRHIAFGLRWYLFD